MNRRKRMKERFYKESVAEFWHSINSNNDDFILVVVFDNDDELTKAVYKLETKAGIESDELGYAANTIYTFGESGGILFQIFIADCGGYWEGLAHEFQHVIECMREFRPELCKDVEYIPNLAGEFWNMYMMFHNTVYHEMEIDGYTQKH